MTYTDKHMYTIEDLKNGKCAVINDGTPEELSKVLKLAFPDDDGFLFATNKFYLANFFGDSWRASNRSYLPKQSVKYFLPC